MAQDTSYNLPSLEEEYLPSLEDIEKYLPTLERGEVEPASYTPPPPREVPVSTVDPDSFLNQAAIGWDNVKGGWFEGIGLFADMMGLDEDAQKARELAEESRLEAQARPQPSVSPSVTKEAKKIAEGEVDSVFEHMMSMIESLTATALPSVIPSIGAYALAEKTAPLISWIPYIGKPAASSLKLAMSLLPR